MAGERVKRKLSAILCADVVGYSRLMGVDETATLHNLKQCEAEVIEPVVKEHNGRIFKRMGDGFLIEFSSAVDSVDCAIAWQKEIQDRDYSLKFRMGINLGDIIADGDDMYGDGVNIAARVEKLADPGGICISHEIFSQTKKKISLGFEYLGEQKVKNISEPIRVYKLLTKPEDAGKVIGEKKTIGIKRRWLAVGTVALIALLAVVITVWNDIRPPKVEVAELEKMAFPLPDKPSIAVLPFTNISQDHTQEYFCDGITENIISSLSKVPNLFVIARNSTFTYKDKPVEVQQVAEEQGVRYVLEGSVQWSDSQVRISAQLVDAITGHHLWSDLYDRELKDIFALQDEITMEVTRAVGVQITAGEQAHLWGKGTDNLKAFLKVLEGRGYTLSISEQNTIARRLFEEAISLDPEYDEAYAHLAASHLMDVRRGRSESPLKSLQKSHELALKALALDDTLPEAHRVLGSIYIQKRQYDKAISESERAVALDPNGADAYMDLGKALNFSGRSEEAIPVLEKALRLNPFPKDSYFVLLGAVYRNTGDYEKALAMSEKAVEMSPDHLSAHRNLAAIYIYLGREEEARLEAEEVLRINPKHSLERYANRNPQKNEAEFERYLDALRKAGLPD